MDFTGSQAVEAVHDHIGDFKHAQVGLNRIDRWWRWDHDKPHAPRTSTKEYRELAARSQTPWLGLVVTAVAQALSVEGYRGEVSDGSDAWRLWQANGMDARQNAIHRAALGYGVSYVRVIDGVDKITGETVPEIRGFSPRRLMGFYDDPAVDEWPMFALQVDPKQMANPAESGKIVKGLEVRLWGDSEVHILRQFDESAAFEHISAEAHGAPICPIVKYANQVDLEGRTPGEVEPFIAVAARIDQTTFDRLVVQRFASWVVRTIAGMAEPSDTSADAEKLRMKVEDILIAEDSDTKFGSLPATPLDGFIKAKDADIRDLAAVTQTPPHHLLGQMANLSADALAAAEASLMRKVDERKTVFGEAHEQTLRLASMIAGNPEAARDFGAQIRWKDIESRSLAQTADALLKMAQGLGIPAEGLWSRIPGVTDQDIVEWKELRQKADKVAEMLADLLGNTESPPALQPAA